MMSSSTEANLIACVNCGHYNCPVSEDAQIEVTKNLGRNTIKGEYVVLPIFTAGDDVMRDTLGRRIRSDVRKRTGRKGDAIKTFGERLANLQSELIR
jgi:hypothetical protein